MTLFVIVGRLLFDEHVKSQILHEEHLIFI